MDKLYNIIHGIDERFILESENYTIGYVMDGDKRSYNTSADSENDAKKKFAEYMKGNGKKSSDYKISDVFISNIEEDAGNTTSNLDGGFGQPKTPNAFHRSTSSASDLRKQRRNATRSTGFDMPKQTKHNYKDKVDEMYQKSIDKLESVMKLSEAKYDDYRNDERGTKDKINTTISEVNRRLYEIERELKHAVRLRNESDIDGDVFWKTTKRKFSKISERMLRISNVLREFNK